MTDLTGKVVIVTGGAQGIGAKIVETFARCGATVIVADLVEPADLRLSTSLHEEVGTIRFIKTNVADADSVASLIQTTLSQVGQLDILISNAGVGGRSYGDGPLHACTVEGWDAIMDVNLRGTFLLCKYALPALIESKGSIVTIASVLGLVGTQGLYDTHAYMTSKAGIIGLTRNIATYYAKDGVRANTIAPGLVDTRMATRTKADPELLAAVAQWQPLGPIGEVDDVAQAALFLATDAAKFITGIVLPVDGGWTAQ